jgi:methionine-rich copper-binding protein CopC
VPLPLSRMTTTINERPKEHADVSLCHLRHSPWGNARKPAARFSPCSSQDCVSGCRCDASAPADVALDFSEAIEPKFSAIEVEDAKGARVDKGDVHVVPDNAKHLVVGLKPLEAGTYTVTWRVTSTDTHKTSGSFSFGVTK